MLWSLICLENALQYSDERRSGYSKYYYCTAGGLHTADVSSMLLHGYLRGFSVQMFTSEHAQPPPSMFFDTDFIAAWLLILKGIFLHQWGCFFSFFSKASRCYMSVRLHPCWFSPHFKWQHLQIFTGPFSLASISFCGFYSFPVFDSGDSASSVNIPPPSLSSHRRDDSLCTPRPDGIKNYVASWFFLSMAAATVT